MSRLTMERGRAMVAEGRDWLKEYIGKHVQRLQELKDNHVHTKTQTGGRVPLTHCRRADNPKLCKADFPRTLWLIRQPVVLCHGLLRKMNLPICGKRNKLGSLHGPMNEENLNGTHPALLAAEGSFNSDVQLPYRLPVCDATTHAPADLCDCDCPAQHDENEVIEATQIAQDAQAGYACDYSNKRSAKTFKTWTSAFART